MKKEIKWGNGFLIVVNVGTFLVLTFLFCKNCTKPEFFKANAYELLTLLCFVVFTYSFTKHQKKQQGIKSYAEAILRCITNELNSIDEEKLTSEKGTLIHRTINNHLKIIEDASEKLDFVKELKYIKEQFSQYKDFWSNHIDDEDYIKKSKEEFDMYKRNMKSKIEEIIMRFYIT